MTSQTYLYFEKELERVVFFKIFKLYFTQRSHKTLDSYVIKILLCKPQEHSEISYYTLTYRTCSISAQPNFRCTSERPRGGPVFIQCKIYLVWDVQKTFLGATLQKVQGQTCQEKNLFANFFALFLFGNKEAIP